MISMVCPNCKHPLTIAEERPGKRVTCSNCNTTFLLRTSTDRPGYNFRGNTLSSPLMILSALAAVSTILIGGVLTKVCYDYYRPVIYPSIFDAAKAGDVSDIKRHFRLGKAVNEKDAMNRTPLHIAANEGHIAICQYLISEGAQVDAVFGEGITPLFLSILQDHSDVSRYLLENGANANIRATEGMTPLHMAIHNGSNDVVELLIQHGADIEKGSDKGLRPLHTAIITNKSQISLHLISRGADINARDKAGNTPLFYAAFKNNLDLVQLLIDSGADANARCNDGTTPLYIAAQSGSKEVFDFLRRRGYWANNENNMMALAIKKGDLDCAKFFLANGLDKNGKDLSGWTYLHEAASNGKNDIASLLISLGADVNVRTTNWDTPLHHAAYQGNLALTQLLVNAGADPNAVDINGYTPLMFAANQNHERVVSFLRPHDRQTSVLQQEEATRIMNENARAAYQERQKQKLSQGELDLLRLQNRQSQIAEFQQQQQVFNMQQEMIREQIRRQMR